MYSFRGRHRRDDDLDRWMKTRDSCCVPKGGNGFPGTSWHERKEPWPAPKRHSRGQLQNPRAHCFAYGFNSRERSRSRRCCRARPRSHPAVLGEHGFSLRHRRRHRAGQSNYRATKTNAVITSRDWKGSKSYRSVSRYESISKKKYLKAKRHSAAQWRAIIEGEKHRQAMTEAMKTEYELIHKEKRVIRCFVRPSQVWHCETIPNG